MASELEIPYQTGRVIYFLVRSATGTIWDGAAFSAYLTASYSSYPITAVEQGSASGYYTANFPATIVPGSYNIVAKQRVGGSPAESDPTIGVQDAFQWNGSAVAPLSDTATSGQLGQIAPIRLAKGTMIRNFPIYLKSSADHVTPMTSGVLSGQIARDGGSFGAFQSGAFTETGLGFYNLQAVTSGDSLGDTLKMLFTAVGISGGSADPLPMSFITQRVSGTN